MILSPTKTVRRTASLLALAHQLESRLAAAQRQVLAHSRAFSGQFVPQDSTDEPASGLLARSPGTTVEHRTRHAQAEAH